MPVSVVSSPEKFHEIIKCDKYAIFDFKAVWCGPCTMISPIFAKLSEDPTFKDAIEFYQVDIDDQEAIANEVGIRAVPTFIVYKNGEKVDDLQGAAPDQLQKMLQKLV